VRILRSRKCGQSRFANYLEANALPSSGREAALKGNTLPVPEIERVAHPFKAPYGRALVLPYPNVCNI
jgi:hypothetical protein